MIAGSASLSQTGKVGRMMVKIQVLGPVIARRHSHTGYVDQLMGRNEEIEDMPELLAQLDNLRRQGILTDKEFEAKKQQLLDQI